MASHIRSRVLGVLAAVTLFEIVPLANAAISYADDRALIRDAYVVERDQDAPAIGARTVEATPTSATLRWQDSESTMVWVYYAIPEDRAASHRALEGTALTDGQFSAEHEVTINGLVSDVEYRYVIESTDRSGNVAATDLASFRTP